MNAMQAYVERFEPTLAIDPSRAKELSARTLLSRFNDADEAEAWLLTQPQTPCPVVNHFGAGVYIREIHVPAGSMIVGHRHKQPTMNLLMKGAVLVATPNGPVRMEAPAMFVSEPGRKFGVVLEDMVFQNIHATDLKDVDAIESVFIAKSEQWLLAHSEGRI